MKTLKWILCILALLSTVFMLFILPDTVPTHYNIKGEPDGFGSKYELLMFPVLLIVCSFAMDPLTKSYLSKADDTDDEKEKAEHITNSKVLKVTAIVTMFLFFFMNIITLYSTYAYVNPNSKLPEFDMLKGIGVIMGITLVVLGNFMTKTRNNANIGFRLSWTRYNDNTWNKSNRFASYVMMFAGAISAICFFFFESTIASILSVIALMIALPIIMIYAYIVYNNERKKDNENNKE